MIGSYVAGLIFGLGLAIGLTAGILVCTGMQVYHAHQQPR